MREAGVNPASTTLFIATRARGAPPRQESSRNREKEIGDVAQRRRRRFDDGARPRGVTDDDADVGIAWWGRRCSSAARYGVIDNDGRILQHCHWDRGPGFHILTGPIFVNGAMPGDVLEVRIQQIDLAVGYGYNVHRPYLGALSDEFPGVFQRVIPINVEAKTAQVAPGVVIPLTGPFFGTLGVAPWSGMGRISSGPPGVHTGNIDNKDVKAGTTLYMPASMA